MAFSPEVKKVKAECWRSPFRAVARDERGRATHFVALSEREMMIAAVTGSVQIPDSQMPAAVLKQRDEQRELEEGLDAFENTVLGQPTLVAALDRAKESMERGEGVRGKRRVASDA